MKRQGGFTLIEMIVVIVILGILAVTAAPKFISFQDDARKASLSGLAAAMQSAASMAHGKYLIDDTYESANMTNGYPSATAEGIGAQIVTDGFSANGFAPENSIQYKLTENSGTDCVQYTAAEIKDGETEVSPPVVSIETCATS
ncbi:Type II secretion system protein G precursor [Grimontia celer]|uniref:Type II secretion system protein G n=1 Tax=Grimontia celer TaxID=1796497 RepID=A0A128F9J8_9GAMM|nr:type II secretion system protein [Grimontia celer]CZF83452.1 Type II secretion system protein G precursor [Grimontia celer]